MLTIVTPRTPDQLNAVRRLCWDYRDFLMSLGPEDREVVTMAYPRDEYADVMDRLDSLHAPPKGGIRLAMSGDTPVACGMFHEIAPGDAEIKRVYVAPGAQGRGIGRRLMETLVSDIRSAGHRRILMDTGKALEPAVALYLSMGFRLRAPYQPVPPKALPRLCFFEMHLSEDPSHG